MKPSDPRLWLGVCAATAVLYMVMGAVGRKSPGPITAVHAAVPELHNGTSCSMCHGGWTSNMTDSCLECHEPIALQFESGKGLHGTVGAERGAVCAQCHSEHHGANFSIINRASFAIAGAPGPENFDHAFLGFEMQGAHLDLTCAECHANADVEVLPAGEHRFLGLDQNCASCHEDPHDGRMNVGCAQCHGQESFETLTAPGHEKVLALLGGHADLDCRTCHAADTKFALERVGRPGAAQRACADCHDSPHADAFIAGVAAAERARGAAVCATCHVPDHESFTAPTIEVSPAHHAHSGFGLGEPHDGVACADCHQGSTFVARHPGRHPDNCASCHDDPHAGQFDTGPFAAEGCVACHGRSHFEPHGFTLDHHAKTALTLTGAHADAECSACHKDPVEGAVRQFHGTATRCEECHDDAHTGFFDQHLSAAPHHEGDCAHCHGTQSFDQLHGDPPFDHARWTGFAITGAHAQAECTTCHERATAPDAAGRRFGRVDEVFGAYTGCGTCHQDPHDGLFDGAKLPAELGGRTGCARCHVPDSFRSFPHGFEHGLWTGFTLKGAHAEASCSACHAPVRGAKAGGRTWAPAEGSACVDCHADPHFGQFLESSPLRDSTRGVGRVDCRRCHGSTTSFKELVFDHDHHARFALGEAHGDLECARCHEPFETPDGRQITRYRPVPRACVDCHGSARDPLRRNRGRRR